MEDFRSRIINVVPSVHYKKVMLLMRQLDSRRKIQLHGLLSESNLSPEEARSCISSDKQIGEIYLLPLDELLLNKLWFRLTDVLVYLKACQDADMSMCLLPLSLEKLLIVDLVDFYSVSLQANRDGTIGL